MLKASICIGEKKRDSPPHSARFASRLAGKRGERKRKEKKTKKKSSYSSETAVERRAGNEEFSFGSSMHSHKWKVEKGTNTARVAVKVTTGKKNARMCQSEVH